MYVCIWHYLNHIIGGHVLRDAVRGAELLDEPLLRGGGDTCVYTYIYIYR